MNISVAVCTWNRAGLLDQTLTEMHKLRIPQGLDWELLIVNNNCTDDTDDVIGKHAKALPIRCLIETRPGQSNARNCAIAAAKGDLIAWTDDDVLVCSNWLTEYASAAERYPAAAFFGGPIGPWFEGTPPEWLLAVWPHVAGAFAAREADLCGSPVSATNLPFGANFAVRTESQLRYAFDPNLGLRPGSSLRGDETTLLAKMLGDNLTGQWVPQAAVRHFIPKSRQTIAFLRSFYEGYGEYQAIGTDSRGCSKLFGRPRWAWRAMIEAELLYRFRRLVFKPEVWIADLIRASRCKGFLRRRHSF